MQQTSNLLTSWKNYEKSLRQRKVTFLKIFSLFCGLTVTYLVYLSQNSKNILIIGVIFHKTWKTRLNWRRKSLKINFCLFCYF